LGSTPQKSPAVVLLGPLAHAHCLGDLEWQGTGQWLAAGLLASTTETSHWYNLRLPMEMTMLRFWMINLSNGISMYWDPGSKPTTDN
jgi:hypothetical protein